MLFVDAHLAFGLGDSCCFFLGERRLPNGQRENCAFMRPWDAFLEAGLGVEGLRRTNGIVGAKLFVHWEGLISFPCEQKHSSTCHSQQKAQLGHAWPGYHAATLVCSFLCGRLAAIRTTLAPSSTASEQRIATFSF